MADLRENLRRSTAALHHLLTRVAVTGLLLLNLAGGLYRVVTPDITGLPLLWDLRGGVRITLACDPATLAGEPLPAECARNVPYLPAAFPFLRWLGSLPWSVVVAGWFVIMLPATVWMFRRTIAHLTHGLDEPSPRAQAVMLVSLLAFKGTVLAMYAGQPSLIVTLLLAEFALLELLRTRSWQWRAALCLALASCKPNLAAPFFAYLLLAGDMRVFATTCAAMVLLHVPAVFAYAGPWQHLQIILGGVSTVDTYGGNRVALAAASGRVDLRPFLVAAGLHDGGVMAAAIGVFATGAAALVRWHRRMGDRLLMVNVNVLFFAVLYHRDYDVPLLLLIALPLIWKHRRRFGLLMCVAALPAVLPIQFLYEQLVARYPDGAWAWHLLGTSMILSVLSTAAWLNWCELRPQRRGDGVRS